MVACELIGDNGGNGKTDARTDVKVQVVKTAVSFFFVLVDFERVRMLPFLARTTRLSVLSCDYHGVARAARKKPLKKDARQDCSSFILSKLGYGVFNVFSKVLCGRRVESKTQEARMVTRLELCGRTMGVCKMDVTEPLVKGSARKYSDREQTAHSG